MLQKAIGVAALPKEAVMGVPFVWSLEKWVCARSPYKQGMEKILQVGGWHLQRHRGVKSRACPRMNPQILEN